MEIVFHSHFQPYSRHASCSDLWGRLSIPGRSQSPSGAQLRSFLGFTNGLQRRFRHSERLRSMQRLDANSNHASAADTVARATLLNMTPRKWFELASSRCIDRSLSE